MAEKAEKQTGTELLSAMMGEQGAEAMQLLRRMERLKRLMGSAPAQKSIAPAAREETGLFARSQSEKMIAAAIPFLDKEYQRDIYVVVRLLEMKRVLGEDWVEAREKQALSPKNRRRQMLAAMLPYLAQAEQAQLEQLLKLWDIKEIMELGGEA